MLDAESCLTEFAYWSGCTLVQLESPAISAYPDRCAFGFTVVKLLHPVTFATGRCSLLVAFCPPFLWALVGWLSASSWLRCPVLFHWYPIMLAYQGCLRCKCAA